MDTTTVVHSNVWYWLVAVHRRARQDGGYWCNANTGSLVNYTLDYYDNVVSYL